MEKGQVSKAAAEPPLTAEGLPLTALGVSSEAFQDALGAYVRANPDGLLRQLPQQAVGSDAKQGGLTSPPRKKVRRAPCSMPQRFGFGVCDSVTDFT